MPGIGDVAGAVTAVTGFEKGSGKTTFLNAALPAARSVGPVAVFSIGVDGALKARDAGGPVGEIRVEAGDVVMTTEAFARASQARFEILEAVPGRTSLGPLLLGRAVRPGSVTLVGSEHVSTLARMIDRVRSEGWAASVLVDGAVNRITQVGALGAAQFVYAFRADPSNLRRVAARVRALAALAALPVEAAAPPGALEIPGPVTAELLKTLAPEDHGLSVQDFTMFFLDPPDLLALLGRRACSLRRGFKLLGFVPALRGLTRADLVQAVGEAAAPFLLPNPCEAAP